MPNNFQIDTSKFKNNHQLQKNKRFIKINFSKLRIKNQLSCYCKNYHIDQ